jgi:cyclopropane-fatty-acyl-phospholipid synthase
MTSEIQHVDSGEASRAPWWSRIVDSWLRKTTGGSLTVTFPDGSTRVYTADAPGPAAQIDVHRGRAVWRMISGGELGFAEAFMDGDWSTPDLTELIKYTLVNEKALEAELNASWLVRAVTTLQHRLRENTRTGSKKNIAYHYDLGNGFYEQWLDETMTYSSAYFTSPTMSLADAQREKIRRLITSLDVKPGEKILEIGCGWGGFAELAARETDASVTGITLSQEQARYARERMHRAGLGDRVDIVIEDYRDVKGTFDKIASIEMFEAVGERYWPIFFDTVRDRLRDGGRAVLQIITIADDRYDAYRNSVDFIQRYIFPGGMLPSPSALAEVIENSGLKLNGVTYFGQSYSETVRQWYERFRDRWDTIAPLGFDERFYRMWRMYLNYCEAGFWHGSINVGQFVVEKP